MSDDLSRFQKQIGALPIKMKRQLAAAIKAEADRLAEAIRDAAPVATGALRDSVTVRRKRNDLELEVTAGGDQTTHGTRGPHGVADYSLFVEYGTRRKSAQPFFYPTARRLEKEIRANITQAIEDALND